MSMVLLVPTVHSLPFQTRYGHTLNEEPLSEEKQDERRYRHEDRASHDVVPARGVFSIGSE